RRAISLAIPDLPDLAPRDLDHLGFHTPGPRIGEILESLDEGFVELLSLVLSRLSGIPDYHGQRVLRHAQDQSIPVPAHDRAEMALVLAGPGRAVPVHAAQALAEILDTGAIGEPIDDEGGGFGEGPGLLGPLAAEVVPANPCEQPGARRV